MKHLFVSYELAVLAKEKGFEQECLAHYNKQEELILSGHTQYALDKYNLGIQAPIYQQLIDWFREKHKIKFSETHQEFDATRYALTQKGELIGIWELDESLEEVFKLIP